MNAAVLDSLELPGVGSNTGSTFALHPQNSLLDGGVTIDVNYVLARSSAIAVDGIGVALGGLWDTDGIQNGESKTLTAAITNVMNGTMMETFDDVPLRGTASADAELSQRHICDAWRSVLARVQRRIRERILRRYLSEPRSLEWHQLFRSLALWLLLALSKSGLSFACVVASGASAMSPVTTDVLMNAWAEGAKAFVFGFIFLQFEGWITIPWQREFGCDGRSLCVGKNSRLRAYKTPRFLRSGLPMMPLHAILRLPIFDWRVDKSRV